MPIQTAIRSYRGRSQEEAARQFAYDAQFMNRDGWQVVAQSWEPGSYGCGAFLVALLLCILLIGIFVFIYMLIVKPDGTLTVTYQRSAADYALICQRCRAPITVGLPACSNCGQPLDWRSPPQRM